MAASELHGFEKMSHIEFSRQSGIAEPYAGSSFVDCEVSLYYNKNFMMAENNPWKELSIDI